MARTVAIGIQDFEQIIWEECSFSLKYAGKGQLFKNLPIWKEEKYQKLQGTYPVISLSFANVKADTFEQTKIRICQILTDLYVKEEK